MSHSAAEIIAAAIRQKPSLSMLVATGNTPIESYRLLAGMVASDKIDSSQLLAVQLDEYLGLGSDDPRCLYGWMDRSFLQPLGIDLERVVRFDAVTEDPDAEIEAYDRTVQAIGGIDIAILGLGPNGHLGFNEPPSGANSRTRVVQLTPQSIASNAAYWDADAEVPTLAFTAGMSTILAARQILLLVSGSSKRTILRASTRGPVTPDVPASILQTVSERVTVLADDAAWGDREQV